MLAAIELGRRTLLARSAERPRFTSPRDLARHLLPRFGACAVERSGVVLLDSRYGLLRTTLLTIGTSDASLMLPRDVLREVVVAGATAFAVFHNHPSGDPSPSDEDREVTARLRAAAALFGVELVDHMILADARYYSFLEMGHLPRERR
jgi:DNA repair protein RadC